MLGGDDQLRFDVTAEPEFDSWRWVDYWSPVREVIYFKRSVYARALEELGVHVFPHGLPPRPDWWSEALARPPGQQPREQRRREGAAVEPAAE
jgi:putative (di)nucleoside polyphosphate hydrolase